MALRKFVFINSTEGFSQEQGSSDELSLGKITFLGVDGVAINAGSAKIVSMADGVNANDAVNKGQLDSAEAAANSYTDGRETQMRLDWAADDLTTLNSAKSYADSLLTGFTIKSPVKAASTADLTLSGEQTVDGVALVAGDRVLVKNQADAKQNGIYVVAAGSWSRAADANTDAEVKDGLSVFVEQGTVNADDTFVLITNNAITLGTSNLEFVKFSGLGQITAGDGLSKSADALSVNVGDGIAIVSDAVAVNLATDPGLQFTSNKLDLKLDTNGGLSKDSAGLKAVSANADNLSVSSAGIDVVGLPLEFKVDGTATSANVTASQLNDLCDGKQIDSAHFHPHTMVRLLAGQGINDGEVLRFDAATGKVVKASCSSAANARVIGIAYAVSAGDWVGDGNPETDLVNVVMSGAQTINTGKSSYGVPLYLGATGNLVEYSQLVSGDRIIRMGFTAGNFGFHVMIQDMGQKA